MVVPVAEQIAPHRMRIQCVLTYDANVQRVIFATVVDENIRSN